MNKFVLLNFFTISASLCFAQQQVTTKYLDSLSSSIDKDNSQLIKMVYDTVGISKDSTAPFSMYQIKQKAGQIYKIERNGQGQCKVHMEYYFANKNVFKIVAKMYCSGTTTWDSVIYYDNGISFDQVAHGNPLYGPYFKQEADDLLKKFGQ
ncbi:MAG: hypothetical protein RIR12_1384 [Bacteroidota bacterium]|jgi:hypothetical protein